MPSSIGVAAALTAEARLFDEWRPSSGSTSRLGAKLSLAVTGVGAERAREGAKHLLAAGADALVSFGFAAGLAAALAPGTLVLPRRVLCDDDRAREVDERLRTLLVEQLAGHRISDGTLAEVRTPLWDAAAKHSLHLRSGAVAADMESGAVAEVAAEMRVPFVVVRAIVDGATREIPACARRALDGDGSVRASTLLVGVVRRPWEIVALLRLARDFNAAHRALAAAAVALRGAAEAFGRW